MTPAVEACKIADVGTAAIVVRGLEEAVARLTDVVQQVGQRDTSEQRKLIARAVGTVIAFDMHDLLMSLLIQHPSLDKHGLLAALRGEEADGDG